MTLTVKRSKQNQLFQRKQIELELIYNDDNKNTNNLQLVAKKFNVDQKLIAIFGFQNHFGGMTSEFKCHIYNDLAALLKYETHAQLARMDILPKKPDTRKPTRLQKQRRIKLQGSKKGDIYKNSMRVDLDVKGIKQQYLKNAML